MTLIPQAPDLAWLSSLVYEDRPLSRLHQRGFELLASFDHNDSEGMLVANGTWNALVFRGTEATKLHWRDIFSNAGLPARWTGQGRIHSGYLRYLNMVRYDARRMLEDVSSDMPVFVAGHSLGGAVATAFASWWYGDSVNVAGGYKLAGLVTFGAPKVLTQYGCDAIKCPIERDVMAGDLAPWHPVSFMLTHPVPATKLKPAKWWRPTPVARHSAEGYAISRAKVG